ncbi:ankyrin repeat protein [Paraphaeosphaeria minitans]|uniref:Ankyrin repeat protein n=1 Tax=Paraphaeosphaeria minitans TaxID=565426 RepID=A0A9P6G7B7_9PLEO|nr:ankyrin repeat protein [Paraphaeosphaeria minitans]
MRLLYTTNDGRLDCTDDLIGDQIPAYAILSHTWGRQEVAFKDLKNHNDMNDVDIDLREGYQKLFFCAQQAKRDGLKHFWVDTCCIDKSNNTELSEAINSMFRWDQNAASTFRTSSRIPWMAMQSQPSSKAGGLLEAGRYRSFWLQDRLNFSLEMEGDWATRIHFGIPFVTSQEYLLKLSKEAGYSSRERALERLKREIQQTGDRLGKICDWLSAPDPSTNYEKAHRQRQAETGLWLVEGEQFRSWKANAASRLWLYGIPGCGKTILTSTIIKDLMQYCGDDTSMVTAYFYFDFNNPQKQDPEQMLRSLLCQLLQRAVTIPEGVDEFTQVYIVLDALDECALRSELMNMLEAVARWKLDNLHLLMASRRERDIERSFETFLTEYDTICLQRDIVDEDIQRYVRQRLCDDINLVKWNKDAAIRREIEVALMCGARGMFRWAVCQLDTLGTCRNRTMLRKSLTTLPKSLDQTYDRILSTIREEDSEYAIRILQWLTFSARPLSVEEIAEIAAIDVARDPVFDRDEVLEDPLEALNICSSLVTITANNAQENSRPTQKTVALAHYSVKDMQESQCEITITKGCLKYLAQFQQPLSIEIVEASALARYAAEFWSTHLRKTGEKTAGLNKLAMDLMSVKNPAYLAWIQLYDPDHPYYGGPELSKGLKSVAAPLYYAALLGLSTITQILVGQGAEVNAQGGSCGNALHAASIRGHGEVVQVLIKAGADIDAQSGHSGNALQAASFEGHTSVVRILLDSNADVNSQGGRYGNALQAASAADRQAVVRLLLAYGANIDAQDGLCGNALNAAAAESHTATVELLLEKGVKVTQSDVQRRSVLHHAINSAFCTTSLVKLLLSRGAPMDTVDIENMTPLHYSIKFGHQSIAGLLLDRGVPIDAGVHRMTWDCNTVETIASYRRNVPEHVCDSCCTSTGLTPLHYAALTGNPVMTEFLLKRGADPNAVSEHKETPLHLTLRKTLHGTNYRDDWTDPSWRAERLWDLLDFEEDDVEAVSADIDRNREGVLNALLADPRTSLTVKDCQHEQVLHCVEYGAPGSASVVQRLVLRGASPSESNRKQQNALHFASRAGDHDAV